MTRYDRFAIGTILSLAVLAAQETTGSITGVVKDPTGAVIVGAAISASNAATGGEFRTVSDESGSYQFPLLRSGTYRLAVESKGFQRVVQANVIVNTSERARIDFTMSVGQLTDTINVTAETPLLQSEKVTIGQVVEQRTIQSIPLATRNFTQILGTSAGVVGDVYNADNPGTGSASVSVNGARRGSNNLLVDGVPTTNPLNNAPDGDGTPSIEFLSEFKVMTSLFSAEYGRNLGSAINVTTRSGTNQLHGSAYEFLRNTKLNARPFFNPVRGQNNQNQYGANVGGPVLIPKVYNGKDRTFFFFGFESSRQRNANSSGAAIQRIVPTLAMRNGDFSQRRVINDPVTGQPFPGAIIPASRINPISKAIQDKFIPVPNFSLGANNFFAAQSIATDIDMWTIKFDHRFGQNDTISGRWFKSKQGDLSPFGQGLPGFGNIANRQKDSGNVTYTHLFSATQVLEGRFGFDDSSQFLQMQNSDAPTTVGLKPLSSTNLDGMPRINILNYTQFGNQANWSDFIKRYTMGATMTWIRGKHNIKYGAESQISDYNPKNALVSRGLWQYNGQASGDEYADFLLSHARLKQFGAPNIGGELKMRDNLMSAFVNDDWKVSERLTINYGARYEYHFQPAAYNLGMVNWWPDRYTGVGTLEGSGIVQGGVNGIPKSGVYNDANNIAPRVGLAYRLGDAWVIRAGAGLYYDTRTGQIAQAAFNNPPTFAQVEGDCSAPGSPCRLNTPDNWTYLDPGYDPKRIPFPTRTTDQQQVWGTEKNSKYDNAWQYNFSVQRQLKGNVLIESAYVGTKGTNLMARRNFNPIIPQADGSAVRRYPGFGTLLITAQNGSSTYHSFQTTVKKRSKLTTMQGAYTWGKTLGNGDDNARFFTSIFATPWNDFSRAKGPANFDRTHRLTVVLNQDLPSKFTGGAGKFLLNNWSVNAFFVAQTGTPITVFNRDSGQGLGGIATDPAAPFFANVNSGVPLVTPGNLKDNLRTYINPAAFFRAPRGTYGNSGRGMLRGPGQSTVDFSVFKDFKFAERFNMQFRTEMFNILNKANFGNPGNNIDNTGYGQITSTSVNARLVQMALKFTF
ncbi:MAG: carboxypeptidase regulatory-like domain-containing protein [Acidobacteria bacterium]|nr:carboxypeptidase regulatory-like domain-containing protein [Acidobacteriota bacterium]